MALTIYPIRAFRDNYIWALHDGQHCVVVDPGDAAPVLAYLSQQQLTLSAILITHHHPDHVGGLEALVRLAPDIAVYGPASERINGLTDTLREGDTVELEALGAQFKVLDVPGHTAGHIAYFCAALKQPNATPVLFCGDTLFSCGCGRLFEGTPAQMLDSLSKFRALPGHTQVYCTHEYTLSNMRFARAVDPNNAALIAREAAAIALRDKDIPTVPFLLEDDAAINPFLRWDAPVVIAAAKSRGAAEGDVATFAAIREWKNSF
jgi:hydroxyacylglutathione hydrolase